MREGLGITLVTPSLNQGRFIEATIQSVLRQDYPRLEYIIMDGGSTDRTLEIIERYADRLAHWESHPDGGQADAVWRGLQMGSGQILGFLNSDDLLLPGSLERSWGPGPPRARRSGGNTAATAGARPTATWPTWGVVWPTASGTGQPSSGCSSDCPAPRNRRTEVRPSRAELLRNAH